MKSRKNDYILVVGVDFGGNLGKKIRQGGFFVGGKMTEDKIDVVGFIAQVAVGTEAKAGKVRGMEVFRDGFEAVIAAAGSLSAEA